MKTCLRWLYELMDDLSFSTVFLSYREDGRVIMKVCGQWNPFYDLKDFLPVARHELEQSALSPLRSRAPDMPYVPCCMHV